MRHPARLLAAALLLATATAHAHEYKIGDIDIGHPWTRATPPVARTAAAYLALTNEGGEADRLVGAASPIASRAEFHTTEMEGNVMRMRHLPDGVPVPAGETVELKPGGLHIMLIDLSSPVEEGKRVPLTLTFEKAGSIDVELAVTGARGADSHGGHGG